MDLPANSEWIALASLVGGGLGAAARGLVGIIHRQTDDEVAYRRELRGAILELNERIDHLQIQLDTARLRENQLQEENAALRAEHHLIRSREHQIRGYLAVLVGMAQRMHKQLGLPDDDLPRVPEWINEPVPGPTTGPAANGNGNGNGTATAKPAP